MEYAAFLGYIFLTAFTPGPNNIMAMTNASERGFLKGLRFNLGVGLGFLVVMTLCALLSRALYSVIPRAEPYMLLLGALYILYLAYAVWRDDRREKKRPGLKLNSVFTGAVLQLVNPKVILYGISAFTSYILPHHRAAGALALFVLLLSAVGLLGTCAWALGGAALERLFAKHKKILTWVMVLLLLYCAYSLIHSAAVAFGAG